MAPKKIPKRCLFIAPIGKEGSDIRRRSDNVLKYIIRPVTDDCGYKAIRADEISDPGIVGRDSLIGLNFVIRKSQEFLQAPDMIN